MSSIDLKRVPRSANLSFGTRKKSARAIPVEHGWVFDQKFVHNDSLVRWSFGTSRATTGFMPKQSIKMVRIDSWDTESSAAISLKLKWRFSVTMSFTLAMLTSVEDVDGRPEWGKSSTTSRPLLNALYHMHMFLIKLIHRKPFVQFSAIPHTKFDLQRNIWDIFFVRYFYQLETSRNTLDINWQHPALWTN